MKIGLTEARIQVRCVHDDIVALLYVISNVNERCGQLSLVSLWSWKCGSGLVYLAVLMCA